MRRKRNESYEKDNKFHIIKTNVRYLIYGRINNYSFIIPKLETKIIIHLSSPLKTFISYPNIKISFSLSSFLLIFISPSFLHRNFSPKKRFSKWAQKKRGSKAFSDK